MHRSALSAQWLLLLLVICASAQAEWSGKGEAGVALASSNANTTTTTVNAKFDLANQLERWRYAFGASSVYASNKDENDVRATTTNRWEVHQQSDFNFSGQGFWFEGLRHESDQIGSFATQSIVTTGFGYKVIDNDATRFALQLGVGYKWFKQRVEPSSPSEPGNDAIASGVLDYRHAFNENTSITEKLTIDAGGMNTAAQNDLALQVKMFNVLALAVGYQLRYNSKPGMRTATAAFGKYDRLATTNLVYEFK
jgi:putative salt-induced outer membrane protein